MKKLLLFLFIAGIATTTKGQNIRFSYQTPLPGIKVDTTVTALAGNPDIEQLRTDKFAKALSKDALLNAYLEKLKETRIYDDTIYSTMPVVGSTRKSKMPVVRPSYEDTRYTMLVKKIDIVDPTRSKTPVETVVRP